MMCAIWHSCILFIDDLNVQTQSIVRHCVRYSASMEMSLTLMDVQHASAKMTHQYQVRIYKSVRGKLGRR